MRTRIRDVADELEQLPVSVGDARDRTGREESIIEVTIDALDAALVRRASRSAELRLDAQGARDLEEPWVVAYGVAVSSRTMVFGLSKSHCRVTPSKNLAARTSERRSDSTVRSKTSSAHIARE